MTEALSQAERLEIFMLKEQAEELREIINALQAKEVEYSIKFKELSALVDKERKKHLNELKLAKGKASQADELAKAKTKNHDLKKAIKEKEDCIRSMQKTLADAKRESSVIIAMQKDCIRHLNDQAKQSDEAKTLFTYQNPKYPNITWTARQGIRLHDDGTYTPVIEVNTGEEGIIVRGGINEAGDSWEWYLSDGTKAVNAFLPHELAVKCFNEYRAFFYKEAITTAKKGRMVVC